MIQLEAPAIGFRTFSWDGSRQLGATGVDFKWPVTKEPQIASCWLMGRHAAPQENCSCGWYARSARPNLSTTIGVGGVILGYGNLVIHPDGFRAEKVEVVALIDPPHSFLPPLQATAEAYGARLVSGWDEAVLLAKEQGGEEIPEALYKQAEENATRPGWVRGPKGWEYHDRIVPNEEPQPVNFTGLPQFFVEFIGKTPEFYRLLGEKRAEAAAMMACGSLTEVNITIKVEG